MTRSAALTVWAAGSLKVPLGTWLDGFAVRSGLKLATRFGPSGTLRREIEGVAGPERPDLFVSADLGHPEHLVSVGIAASVKPLGTTALVALLRAGLVCTTADLLDLLLEPKVRLATSLPGADPSGDYAHRSLRQSEKLHPGAAASLLAKALILAGGPSAPKAPEGTNPYAFVLQSGLADIFLTYQSNARLACLDVPGLSICQLPDALAVQATFAFCPLSRPAGALSALVAELQTSGCREHLSGYGIDPVTD